MIPLKRNCAGSDSATVSWNPPPTMRFESETVALSLSSSNGILSYSPFSVPSVNTMSFSVLGGFIGFTVGTTRGTVFSENGAAESMRSPCGVR